MGLQEKKAKTRLRRKRSIRKKISGTDVRPRLSIFKSSIHIYAQIIDDISGVTLASASSLDKEIKPLLTDEMNKTDKSIVIGKKIAERALLKEISTVSFDRNGYIYHGRVKALADSAREAGLKF
jgi:large subunit ribosomal protein L18